MCRPQGRLWAGGEYVLQGSWGSDASSAMSAGSLLPSGPEQAEGPDETCP